ncbi:hypothetical protein ACHAPE_006022 [Trichoderma viride]
MAHATKIHTRAGSRTSLVSVGQMPAIREDSIIAPAPVMLRIPSKNPRRSLGPQPQGIIIPYITGFQDLPPEMLAVTECRKTKGDDGDEKTVVGQMTPPPTETLKKKRRWNGEEWTPTDSQRKCHLVIVSSVVLVIIAGLATGLTLGLTKT